MDGINITLVLAQLANFLILFLIFKKFIADKLIATISSRRELQAKLEKAAAEYAINLAAANKEKEDILVQARLNAKNMMIEVESLANKKSVDILLAAEDKANLTLEGGRKQLEKERLSMLSQMKSKIIDISLRLNEKLFDDQNASRDFMENEMENIKM